MAARTAVRSGEMEDFSFAPGDRGGDGGRRPQQDRDTVPCGKRVAGTHDPAAGSPRAVRARLRDQASQKLLSGNAPFAVSRRCSFVERRNVPQASTQLQLSNTCADSWTPSCIEPGAFGSVGSAIEVAEAHETPNAPREHYNATAQRRQLQVHSRELGESRSQRAGPVPTPVRSMAVQTNRDSIVRHHNENFGTPPSSDGEESPRVQRITRNALQDRASALNCERGTGNDNKSGLNTARSTLKELKYPAKRQFRISATSGEVMEKSVSHSEGKSKAALVKALTCAMNDECEDLDRAWGIASGGAKSVEDRVATCLKKIAKRAEKACTLNLLAAAKVTGIPSARAAPAGTDAAARARCAELEAEIAQTDRRVADLREALQRPLQPQDSEPNEFLAGLSTRLNDVQRSHEDVPTLGVIEITSNVDKSIQGLVAAEASCRQMLQQCQEEQQAVREHNRGFCPAAADDGQQVFGSDSGARSVLRGIR